MSAFVAIAASWNSTTTVACAVKVDCFLISRRPCWIPLVAPGRVPFRRRCCMHWQSIFPVVCAQRPIVGAASFRPCGRSCGLVLVLPCPVRLLLVDHLRLAAALVFASRSAVFAGCPGCIISLQQLTSVLLLRLRCYRALRPAGRSKPRIVGRVSLAPPVEVLHKVCCLHPHFSDGPHQSPDVCSGLVSSIRLSPTDFSGQWVVDGQPLPAR